MKIRLLLAVAVIASGACTSSKPISNTELGIDMTMPKPRPEVVSFVTQYLSSNQEPLDQTSVQGVLVNFQFHPNFQFPGRPDRFSPCDPGPHCWMGQLVQGDGTTFTIHIAVSTETAASHGPVGLNLGDDIRADLVNYGVVESPPSATCTLLRAGAVAIV